MDNFAHETVEPFVLLHLICEGVAVRLARPLRVPLVDDGAAHRLVVRLG